MLFQRDHIPPRPTRSTALALVVLVNCAAAQDPAPLDPPRPDWLIDSSSFTARVHPGASENELVLENGLIRRTFRLAPNAATVGLDDLVRGEAILRAVEPEALVTIDGVPFEVGGLRGQPDRAYLTPAWLERLTANPRAMRFCGYQVGKPRERFAWKRVRHHAPNTRWPPAGVHLRMDYEMPPLAPERLERGPRLSAWGRTRLLGDDFKQLDLAWKVHASKVNPRSSFTNEGKVGEIYTPANTAVYVERPLPAGTRLVEVTIDCGTDRSASWGPGIALVFPGRVVKLNLRPGGDGHSKAACIGAFDGQRELIRLGGPAKLDLARPWTLRLRMAGRSIHMEARPAGGTWRLLHTVELKSAPGTPRSVRIGKLDASGAGADFRGEKGALGRLRIIAFAAYSGLNERALGEIRARLEQMGKVRVAVHYELYDGVPLYSKWISVHNGGKSAIRVDRFSSEILAVVEQSNWVEKREGVDLPRPAKLHAETEMAFGGFNAANANRHAVHWRTDPRFRTQVNYLRHQPCRLVIEPTYGPAQEMVAGASFDSFRAFVLVYDSSERERRSLALRRMYRTIAPWVTENPLMMHVRWAKWETVRAAIDQCAEVGFEMVILTFGSGFNIENDRPEYLAQMKRYAEYARSKGIEIGGYSLLSSRHIGGGNDIVSPKGQRPTHGSCPALASAWGQAYFRKLYRFFEQTGFRLLEHDGSYPGDVDTTPRPPLQKGARDSRWVQWRIISDFYKWCRGRGIYLNVPDYYYLAGSNKCGMGYRETNWSLPRAQQVIHTRQNIYDGTWSKTPSMGWMFVPLTQYHGGGAAATIEPLDEHLHHYERMLRSNLAMGVQACYRGPRLYDTERTRALVKRWVDWFHRYRDILESDLIHGRRADGRDLDWMLHVNPRLETKGLLVVFNPLARPIEKTLRVNLYYTGLEEVARIRSSDGKSITLELDRRYDIELPVKVAAQGMAWYCIE